MKRGVCLLAVLATLLAACGREAATRNVDDLVIMLSVPTNDIRVGEVVIRARIADRTGAPIPPSAVRFHYYPFVDRVKDSLASPDEVVRVVEGVAGPDGHAAKVNFEKPGPWKVTVSVARSERPRVDATFTFDVRG